MNKILIAAKRDFLERLAAAAPVKAIAELVWNGFDAGADLVDIRFELNRMNGLEKITVRDTGAGIDHSRVSTLFGNLGESWKKTQNRFQGRALHGKAGQGRLKAFALGNHVQWVSVFTKDDARFRFHISGRFDALDSFEFSNPVPANGDMLGTEVIVTGIEGSHGTLLSQSAPEELAKLFAAYLSQYPEVRLNYDGERVDPAALQDLRKELPLGEFALADGTVLTPFVTIIEWKVPTKRVVHLCDASGVSLYETESGAQVRAPGFHFTAYIKCDHFRELDKPQCFIIHRTIGRQTFTVWATDGVLASFSTLTFGEPFEIAKSHLP